MNIQRSVWGWCAGAVLIGLAGCAAHPLIASNSTHSGKKFGSFGITGYGNNVTIDRDSYLSVLSIIGDGNSVNVEDGADVFKIEIWGRNNTISVPWYLVWREKLVGNNNQIIPRPRPTNLSGDMMYSDSLYPTSAPSE